MIKRDKLLKKIISSMWNGEIKVITGIRRCGKSTLLFDLFYDYLKSQNIVDDNILQIKLDQRKFYKYRNPIVLCEYVESIVQNNKIKKFYLFIDEVQMTTKVIDKENGNIEVSIYDMLNELRGYKNLDVYVTGSNSKMLSSDILTEFRGRATQIYVSPLTFEEFYFFRGGDEEKAFYEYMLFGGMPAITEKKTEEEKKAYLSGLYSEIYIKDLIERGEVKKEDILNKTLDFLASSISSLTNTTNIANIIGSSNHEKIDTNLISRYVDVLKNAFLVKESKRYDIKGKNYFLYPSKFYYVDTGLRNSRLNFRQFDQGHIMENIIYNELINRGYSVDVGVVYKREKDLRIAKEIDFIVNDGDRKIYIQSAYQMENDSKIMSEIEPLKLTNDFFKKIILRNDIYHNFYDEDGIFNCSLMDFLLNRVSIF